MSETPAPEPIVLKSLLDFREKTHISPMTESQSMMFLQLFAAEREDLAGGKLTPFNRTNLADNRHAAVIEKISSGFGFKVFAGRMHPETQITFEAFVFVLDMCKGPGDAVLWCYALHRIYQKDKALITLSVLADYWPFGFPNEEGRHLCWRAQKAENYGLIGDNLYDKGEFWE